MQLATRRGKIRDEDIQYLNAHATSTPLGDYAEAQAIMDTFGRFSETLSVSSTKSMTGHLLGGAGSLDAGITVLALRDQIAPPTTNLEDLDERCQLNFILESGRRMRMDYAMTNPFGFGGTNASLIFEMRERPATRVARSDVSGTRLKGFHR